MEEGSPTKAPRVAKGRSEDWQVSNLPWEVYLPCPLPSPTHLAFITAIAVSHATEDARVPTLSPVFAPRLRTQAAEQPAPLDEYMAQRVEWTPVMLASKLRQAVTQDGSVEAALAEASAASSEYSSPTKLSTPGGSPTPAMRERSHHKPALLISPDSDRRGTGRAAAGGGVLGNLGLSIEAASDDGDSARSFGGGGYGGGRGGGMGAGHGFARARDLAVAVPMPLSRPSSGGPSLIVGSRPSSAASSCGVSSSSRPSSASFVFGHGGAAGLVTPGGTRPVSQRRLVAEYDAIISKVWFGEEPGSWGKLLLGAELASKDLSALQLEGVTHVVNCAGLACANHHPDHFRYLKLNLQVRASTPASRFVTRGAPMRPPRASSLSLSVCVLFCLFVSHDAPLVWAVPLCHNARPRSAHHQPSSLSSLPALLAPLSSPLSA